MQRSNTFKIVRASMVFAALSANCASGMPFTSTFAFPESLNVSTFLSGGSFTGFNYGFTSVLNDASLSGTQVTISEITLSATALSHGPIVNFDWLAFVGPGSFGLPVGQITNSLVFPQTIAVNTTSAPTQDHIVFGRLTNETGLTLTLSATHDYVADTDVFSPNFGHVTAGGTFTNALSLPSGLFAQVFIWSEDGQQSGTNIDFSSVRLSVSGNETSTIPEPASWILVSIGLTIALAVQRRPFTCREQ